MAVWMYLKHVQTNQRQSLVFFAVTDHTWLDTWTIAVLPGVEVFNCILTHQKDCTEQKQLRSWVVLSPWWNTSMDKLEQPSGLALPCLKANSLHRTIHPPCLAQLSALTALERICETHPPPLATEWPQAEPSAGTQAPTALCHLAPDRETAGPHCKQKAADIIILL